jgi:DNA polymerase-3 subunit gamma/tau
MAPVRDRFKVFIIDEFHQLSSHSFNALLKSIEEPPAHVVFMMATTELRKIPDTILSRSQVYELRTISTSAIAQQLRTIAEVEQITINDAAIALIARAGDGSMRDAEGALDQVLAFAGDQIGVEEVSTVLGLIGRDPVLDVIDVVANEDSAAVFELAERFVEAGYDLRLVCRELTRAVRDLLVISINPARADDPEIAGDADRSRLVDLAQRFSREDLMRAFDVLAKAEFEIRSSAQPRYHFEMAVIKWIHLGKLVSLTALLEGLPTQVSVTSPIRSAQPAASSPQRPTVSTSCRPLPLPSKAVTLPPPSSAVATASPAAPPLWPELPASGGGTPEILAEVKRAKKFFHGTVVAQAQRIDLEGDKLVFVFTPGQRTLASQLRQNSGWLEQMASKIVGRQVVVITEQRDAELLSESVTPESSEQALLREQAMSDPVVQSIFEVFSAEVGSIEKLE